MALGRRQRVIYVEPGKDPKQARIEYYQSLKRRSSGGDGLLPLLLAGAGFVALVAVGIWWWGSDNNSLFNKQQQHTPAVLADVPPPITTTPTPTVTPSPAPIPITTTPTPTPTEHTAKTKLQVQQPLSPILPTDTPRPPHPAERTPTATPTITNTPTPVTDYTIIANEIISEPERVYPVVSGWIVEADGVTPRPVAVALRWPGGEMRYPRPNNVDIANGHYEFLASPGAFELVVLDGDYPAVPVVVSDNPHSRYEISLRYNKSRAVSAAISNPWNEAQAPKPVEAVYTSPVPTPTPNIHSVYLPMVLK